MRCEQCHGDNEPDARFCGFCGRPFSASLITEPAGAARVASSRDTQQVWVPPRRLPVTQPPAAQYDRSADDADLATTRWLCAAVTLDADLEHRVLENVLEEEQRAVITTPGVDLVTVLKYALAAHHRRLVRDLILGADLLALVVMFFFFRSFLLFFVLLFVAWVTVFAHRYIAQYGQAVSDLRPGRFDPRKVHSPPGDSFAGRQLQRIAAAGTTGNVTLYSGFAPFRGYGTPRSNWSFAVDITRGPESLTRMGQRGQPKAFSALEVYDYVKAGLRALDLPGMQLGERLFVNSRDIHGDPRFLPEPGRAPVTSIQPELMRQMLVQPEEWARPYLTVSMTSWQGDLVVTTFIRFLVSSTDLFVEAAHSVVPPLRAEFKAIDERDPGADAGEFFGLAFRSATSTIPRLLGSVPGILHEFGANSRREKKRRRVEETRDYGALVSVRELAADSKWQRYFQLFDDERFVKIIEQRILRCLIEFLKQHNVDTGSLESRAEMLINNGVVFGDNASVRDSHVAGAGSRIGGLVQNIRGGEGARSSEGAG